MELCATICKSHLLALFVYRSDTGFVHRAAATLYISFKNEQAVVPRALPVRDVLVFVSVGLEIVGVQAKTSDCIAQQQRNGFQQDQVHYL